MNSNPMHFFTETLIHRKVAMNQLLVLSLKKSRSMSRLKGFLFWFGTPCLRRLAKLKRLTGVRPCTRINFCKAMSTYGFATDWNDEFKPYRIQHSDCQERWKVAVPRPTGKA